MCVYVVGLEDHGAVFTLQVTQGRGAFGRFPDVSNLTADLCALRSIRGRKQIPERTETDNKTREQQTNRAEGNVPDRSFIINSI